MNKRLTQRLAVVLSLMVSFGCFADWLEICVPSNDPVLFDSCDMEGAYNTGSCGKTTFEGCGSCVPTWAVACFVQVDQCKTVHTPGSCSGGSCVWGTAGDPSTSNGCKDGI